MILFHDKVQNKYYSSREVALAELRKYFKDAVKKHYVDRLKCLYLTKSVSIDHKNHIINFMMNMFDKIYYTRLFVETYKTEIESLPAKYYGSRGMNTYAYTRVQEFFEENGITSKFSITTLFDTLKIAIESYSDIQRQAYIIKFVDTIDLSELIAEISINTTSMEDYINEDDTRSY